jgi:peptidoglycan/LPS O-acetylase OafA/YrhL
MSIEATSAHSYRADIDALRAIAVGSVIAYHFNEAIITSGFLGVDVFFVISGYVISGSLANRPRQSFADFLSAFYGSRIKRILPALAVCVVATVLIGFLFISPETTQFHSSWKAGVAALFGLSNIYFLKVSADYFDMFSGLNLFTQTWSLGVEEQFYFIYPAIFWISQRSTKFSASRPLCVMAPLAAASLLSYVVIFRHNQSAAFFLMPTRFWELAAGCITYFAVQGKWRCHWKSQLPALVAFTILILALFTAKGWEVWATFLAVVSTSIIIGTLLPGDILHRMLILRPLVYVGRISYSLYLWHWSVLVISRWTIGVHDWLVPIQLGTIFALAVASFHYVEQPLRKAVWSSSPFKTITYGLSAATVAASLIVVLGKPLQGALYTGEPARLAQKGVETLGSEKLEGERIIWPSKDCELGSNAEIGKVIDFDHCTVGDVQSAGRHVLVIGNSFSAAEFEMYTVLTEDDISSVTVTSSWAASPVPEIPNHTPWAGANDYYWNSIVPQLSARLRNGDILVMVDELTDLSPENPNTESRELLLLLKKGLTRIAREMESKGVGVIFQNELSFIIEARCDADMAKKQWFGNARCKYYSRDYTIARRRLLENSLNDLERGNANFHTLDLLPVFCPDLECKYYTQNGTPLYRDIYSHPSVEANMLSRPIFKDVVQKTIADLSIHTTSADQ